MRMTIRKLRRSARAANRKDFPFAQGERIRRTRIEGAAALKAEEQVDKSGVDYPAELRRTLLNLYFSGELSADRLLQLCRLITRSGGQGVEGLDKNIAIAKNSSRAVGAVVGAADVKRELLQYVKLPLRAPRGKRAVLELFPVVPVYEAGMG